MQLGNWLNEAVLTNNWAAIGYQNPHTRTSDTHFNNGRNSFDMPCLRPRNNPTINIPATTASNQLTGRLSRARFGMSAPIIIMRLNSPI